MVRGVGREEAGEQPGHAASESGQAGTENANVEFYVAPESGKGAFVGHIGGNGNGVNPDKAQHGNNAGAVRR